MIAVTKSATLGSIARFVNGAAFKPTDWDDDRARIIRIQNLNDPDKPYNRTNRKVGPDLQVHPGDLLVSWSASLVVFVWGGPDVALLNQHIFRVFPNETLVNRDYLKYALQVAVEKMKRQVHGATMQHINRGEFLATEIPLPSIDEQQRIASILDKADEVRAKRITALETLEPLIRAVFIDMFGDPFANPMGWPEKPELGDIADITSGFTKGRVIKNKDYKVRTVPYLAVSNVQDGYLNLEVVKEIEATDHEIEKFKLYPGDLRLTEGGDPDKLGRGTVWGSEITECIHQNHIFRVRVDSEHFHPLFVSRLIASERGKRYFLRSAKQTTGIASINKTQLSKFRLPRPPISLQEDFASQVAAIGSIGRTIDRASRNAEELFASLSHQAFQGAL